MQQTFPCPKCGSQNTVGTPSCKACGENFKYTCPQCGVIVDTKFKVCTKCGASLYWPIHDQAEPTRPAKKRKPVLIVVLSIMAVSILTGLAIQIFFEGTPFAIFSGTSLLTPEPMPATTEAIEITAEELLQAYRTDRKTTEAEYKDKILRVTGIVSNVGTNFVGTPFVKLSDGSIQPWRVRCMFDKEYGHELAQVTKGETITVQGKCDNCLPPDATMKDCVLVH